MFVALITARGGSKGLPRKNVLSLNGLPLIGWTIQAAMQSSYIGRVFVSTDDLEIATVSKKFGAEIIQRPSELASDTASSIDVVSHAINWFRENDVVCQDIVLLQPTSPLRTYKHLNEAIELYKSKPSNFVISVFEPEQTPIKSYIENDDGTISGLYSEEAPYKRRQDLPRSFQPNGAIYAFSIGEFQRNHNFPKTNVFPYLMPVEFSLDIDTFEDLVKAEQILKELNDE